MPEKVNSKDGFNIGNSGFEIEVEDSVGSLILVGTIHSPPTNHQLMN
jgi:hypothetical protein